MPGSTPPPGSWPAPSRRPSMGPTSSFSSGWSCSSPESSSTASGSRRAATRGRKEALVPFGDFVNQIPPIGFLAIHVTLFLVGAIFAWRTFATGSSLLAWAFALFALAEISYMTYHLDWTVFLFAHTISEVLDAVAFVLVFAAATASVRTSVTPARAAR